MPRKPFMLVSSLLAFALVSGANAQTQATPEATGRAPQSATKPRAKGDSAAKSAAASRARRETREAVAALREVAEAARSFEYAFDKVRIQTEVADTLWPFDEQSARAILRRAWEVTTAPGADDAFGNEDDPRFVPLDHILAARDRVITRAAKHDARLAESLLQENARDLASRSEAEREAAGLGDERAGPHDVWRHPSEAARQRLSTANSLINIGAYKSAADFASPVIAEGASRPLLNFILRLRAFDPRAADNFYMRLLDRTRLDADADANDVLLLSTPVTSPDLLVSIGADGSTYFMDVYQHDEPDEAPPQMSQSVRRAFLDTAATVLSRAAAPRAGASNADADAMAGYFAIGRLLPFFDREMPQHAPLLRARMAALSQQIEEAKRNAASNLMETRSLKPKNPTDPLRFETEEIKRAASETERDRWRMAAVSLAADRKLWDRARQLADDISDAETRHAARFIIAVRQVTSLLEAFEDEKAADDFERAAAFARAADVPPAARAIGLAQAAELAARKGKRARASALFGEALTAASHASGSKELRVTTLALLADTATRLSEQSAWELLAQLVAAVNDAGDSVDREDVCAGVSVGYDGDSLCISLARRVPEPDEVFAKMASLDFERAVKEARTLKDEVTRAEALLAAARAVLLKNSSGRTALAR